MLRPETRLGLSSSFSSCVMGGRGGGWVSRRGGGGVGGWGGERAGGGGCMWVAWLVWLTDLLGEGEDGVGDLQLLALLLVVVCVGVV